MVNKLLEGLSESQIKLIEDTGMLHDITSVGSHLKKIFPRYRGMMPNLETGKMQLFVGDSVYSYDFETLVKWRDENSLKEKMLWVYAQDR